MTALKDTRIVLYWNGEERLAKANKTSCLSIEGTVGEKNMVVEGVTNRHGFTGKYDLLRERMNREERRS